MSDTLKQLREKLAAKRAKLGDLFAHKSTDDDGATVYDFQAVEADWLPDDVEKLKGGAKTTRICEIVKEYTTECEALHDKVVIIEEAETSAKAFEERARLDREPAAAAAHPEGTKAETRGFGERVVADPLWKQWAADENRKGTSIKLPDMGMREIRKTLFETTAGWAPESLRTGQVVEAVTRPIQVIDIMPTGNTGFAQVVYMEETTRNQNAAEKAEGAAYAESEFVLTERSSTVRKITDSVPVTDEQLEDVAMAQSYLEGRLLFGVTQRLDQQVISGDGIAPNLDGILNVGGIQTQAKGADPVPDAILKAMTLVRVTGRAVPTHCLLHPTDSQNLRLLRTADGIYIWGSPSDSVQMRIWGLPVVENESLSQGTGLVGSFMAAWIQLVERRGITVEMGFVNDDFTKGKQTLRASGRWALPVYRPPAFCTVTGLPA
ncbi:MAG TPA: phage major capsid protein [Aurantimonas coralicida]|uniref:Phage major capsid protein n=1 Tax=Aurantimonas coralicida TaxID=182270 RepID=A0A9C9ND38_9HYPH|nr:phage major capsid protein [Aurantimonas coralicida]